MRLTASTLYGAVARLLDARLIEELEPEAGHERRRPYRLTRAGRRLLEAEAARLARATGWAAAKRLLPHPQGSPPVNALLRWLVRLSLRLSPRRHRDRFGGEFAATVNALAGEARARGRGVERGYLLQELADSLRESVGLWRSGETSWAAAGRPRSGRPFETTCGVAHGAAVRDRSPPRASW